MLERRPYWPWGRAFASGLGQLLLLKNPDRGHGPRPHEARPRAPRSGGLEAPSSPFLRNGGNQTSTRYLDEIARNVRVQPRRLSISTIWAEIKGRAVCLESL